ncbi:MAG: hypothetical protein M2R45_04721 [Verrucomicrobia subdivision 3 bacterium]|nr:hypothetical protein [Limisphaerales bacterium]MCS1416256.1 hypothetical protein [Limisphaerales bacterium]
MPCPRNEGETVASERLYAFYDPPSRRMKVASVPYSSDKSDFYHRGRVYRRKPFCDEVELVRSKDNKIIGFGFHYLELEPWFCPAFNARNAVLEGHRNDVYLHPGETYSSLQQQSRKYPTIYDIYWYLTETWEEFEERVSLTGKPLADPLDQYVWADYPLYISEGVSDKGGHSDDCIIDVDNYSNSGFGFELATENIPQRIDAQTFRPPSPETP